MTDSQPNSYKETNLKLLLSRWIHQSQQTMVHKPNPTCHLPLQIQTRTEPHLSSMVLPEYNDRSEQFRTETIRSVSLKYLLPAPLQKFTDLGYTEITHFIILCVGKNVAKMCFHRLRLEAKLVKPPKLCKYSNMYINLK